MELASYPEGVEVRLPEISCDGGRGWAGLTAQTNRGRLVDAGKVGVRVRGYVRVCVRVSACVRARARACVVDSCSARLSVSTQGNVSYPFHC